MDMAFQKDENGHDVAAVRSDSSSQQTTASQKKTQRPLPFGPEDDWHFWIQSQQRPNDIRAYAVLVREDLKNETGMSGCLQGYGVLYNVIIEKQYRRQGYLGLLLDYIMETVNKRFSQEERDHFFSQKEDEGNRSKLYLSVDKPNTVAKKAYQKYGFRRITQGFKQGQYNRDEQQTNKGQTYFYMCRDINQPLPQNTQNKLRKGQQNVL